jgi:hypothetical protein
MARNWENLPSLAVMPVPSIGFSYADLVHTVHMQASDKQLVSLVEWGWTVSQAEAFQQIDRLYDFNDDPELAVMVFQGGQKLIIRASFMYDTVSAISASTFISLRTALLRIADERGKNSVIV